jgi:hypothetical protein
LFVFIHSPLVWRLFHRLVMKVPNNDEGLYVGHTMKPWLENYLGLGRVCRTASGSKELTEVEMSNILGLIRLFSNWPGLREIKVD